MSASLVVRRTIAVFVLGLLPAARALGNDRSMSFQTSDRGAFLTAPNGGGSDLFADKFGPGEWETFRVIDLNGGRLQNWDPVCLRTSNGHFVVAENGGGREAKANRPACGPWEVFRIVVLDGGAGFPTGGAGDISSFLGFAGSVSVGLQASDGHWLSAENGGGGAVSANRPGFGRWERFRVFHH